LKNSPDNPSHTPSPDAPLPRVTCALTPKEIIERLDLAARRGRLAGYAPRGDAGFTLDAFGTPFEFDINAGISPTPAPASTPAPSTIRFSMIMRKKMPIIFALVLLFTVEPGRYFTDQLIPGSWNWINTMYWYYPLTILPLPWLWRSLLRKSSATGREHALEQIAKVAKECEGTVAQH